MPGLDRRTVSKGAAAAAAAAPFSGALSRTAAAADAGDTEPHRLEGSAPEAHAGATWGVPWPRGAYRPERTLRLTTAAGDEVPVQSWVTGYRPDGSVKWTAHALAPGAPKVSACKLAAGSPAAPGQKVTVTHGAGRFEVSTGAITAVFGAKGPDTVVRSVRRGSAETARDGKPVALRQESVREGADVTLVDMERTFLETDPQRKVRTDRYIPGDRHAQSVGFGTDRGGIPAAWLTEWERRGPNAEKAQAEPVTSLRTIAAQPNGFFTGTGLLDAATGKFAITTSTVVSVSRSVSARRAAPTSRALAAIRNLALIGDRLPS